MPVTIKVNGAANSLVHKGSNGISTATMPDVCKTPSPGGPVPVPYPNVSQSATLANGTTTVKADGGMMVAVRGSEFSLSSGDEAGVAGGVKSSTFMKESTWILYSFDVKMDGRNACRLTDKKLQNHENTADLAGVFQPPRALRLNEDEIATGECLCEQFCKDLRKSFSPEKTRNGKRWVRKPESLARLEEQGRERKALSYELEQRLKEKPPACFGGRDISIRETFNGDPKSIPDVVLRVDGTVRRCFDFKFPGDRWRGTQRERLREISGRQPVEISHKTCAC